MTEREFTPPTEFPAEYVTRDGRKAVIVARTPDNIYSFVGWFEHKDGSSCSASWTDDGGTYAAREHGADLFDIVPEPQKRVQWMNDYVIRSVVFWHDTREKADVAASQGRFAVIRREIVGEVVQYFAEKV